MQNQIKKAMGFAAVLLLLIVALMAAVTVHADAPTGYHEIKVITSGGDSTCKIEWTGVDTIDGKYCLDGGSIKVRATAGDGYTFVNIVAGDGASYPRGTSEITVTAVTEDLTFTAYFEPKVYTIEYVSNQEDASIKTIPELKNTYTYKNEFVDLGNGERKEGIELYIPEDTPAHRFVGWYEGENAIKINEDGKYLYTLSTVPTGDKIRLTARFEPKEIGGSRVDKDWLTKNRIPPDKDKTGETDDVLYTNWKYGDLIAADENLKDPDGSFRQYPGYTFITGDTKYYTEITVSATQKLNEVIRYYVPNVYQVTFDACGGILSNPEGTTISVTFNQKISDFAAGKLPTRAGYVFAGYYTELDGRGTKYIDSNGTGSIWDIPENTTLYAYWVAEDYQIDFSDALTEHATITVKQGNNTYTYDGTPLSFAYNTEITITIAAKHGYKLVQWNGNKVEHAAEAAFNYTISAENQTLSGVVLQSCAVPEFSVDYTQETLLAEGTGDFELKCGDTTIPFKGGDKVSLKSFFGKEILVRRLGDGEQTSHSDWKKRQLASRPAAPIAADADENGKIQKPTIGETSILLELTDADTVDYEFAFRRFENEALVWQDVGNLTNLNAGTVYTVFIRVKATENAPHGEEYSVSLTTLNENYLKGKIEELRGRIQKGDGQNVKNLIQSYIAKMEALQTGPDYQNKMDALIAECDNRLPLARYKDKRIAEIEARCEELRNGSLYNDAGKETLEMLRANAVAEISDAASQSGVDTAFEDFGSEVAKIPVRIDLTWLFIALGTVILLQVVALVILLRRHAKYADRVKYVRDGKPIYGFVPLPVLAMTTRFLPEKSALVALLLGVVALVLQIVLVVLIFRTAAIAKKAKSNGGSAGTEFDNGTQAPHDGGTEAKSDSEPTTDAFAFEPQVSVFHDDDASSFDHDNSTDGLQEEDWYDENYEDDSSADTFESDDGEE